MTSRLGVKRNAYCLTDLGRAMAADRENLRFVDVVIARNFGFRGPHHDFLDDLTQAGREGLCDAVAHYRPGSAASFRTYSAQRIWGACQDYLRTRAARGLTPHRDARKVKVNDRPAVHSIFVDTYAILHVQGSDDYVFDPIDWRVPPAPGLPVGREAETTDNFDRWLGALNTVERFIVRKLYDREPWTMKQVGQHLGLTESRVSQMHIVILEQLRHCATFPRYRELASA